MAGLCQECTACCTVFEIKEIGKPFGQTCAHVTKTLVGPGCARYDERPHACWTYICLWLESQRRKGQEMPEALRPDVCHVVMGWPYAEDRETLFVYPLPGHEDAWKKDPVSSYLKSVLARGGKLMVVTKHHRIAVKGDMAIVGTEEEFAQLLH